MHRLRTRLALKLAPWLTPPATSTYYMPASHSAAPPVKFSAYVNGVKVL